MTDQRVRKWVYAGLLTAMIALTTGYIKINLAVGYVHIGDGAIFLAALLLGPFAAVPAAAGSALADLLAGYPQYIPATIVIKGLMGYLGGRYLLRGKEGLGRNAMVLALLGVLMVCGYFGWSTLLFGYAAALGEVPPNLLQAASGLALGLVCAPLSVRLTNMMHL